MKKGFFLKKNETLSGCSTDCVTNPKELVELLYLHVEFI